MTERRVELRTAGAIAPIVVAAVATLLRDVFANTSSALVLVLVIVAVGAAGDRVAGVLAAVSAAMSFDFFLAVPYYRLTIAGPDDVETAVLLVAIGVAVTEIVQWGRRHQARSSRREGYLSGVARVARMAGDPAHAEDLADTVARMIVDVLDLDRCRYEPAPGGRGQRPYIDSDGRVLCRDREVDVERDGLPTMDVIELPAGRGRFLLVSSSSTVRRPDLEQLLVAVTLAEQVGLPQKGHPSNR